LVEDHPGTIPVEFGQIPMKALGLEVSDKIFSKLHFENLLVDPVAYLCNQLERFSTTSVKEHLVIIPVKFGQNPMSGFRGEDV